MPKLAMGKMRDPEHPYLVVEDANGLYGPTTFKVLKAYVRNPDQQYARAMVCAISPATGPGGDWGDAYWGDITGVITYRDPVVQDSDLPSHLRGGPMVGTTLAGVLDEHFGK